MFKSNRKPMQVGNLVRIKSGVPNISETVWLVTKVTMVNGGSFQGKVDRCHIEPVTTKAYEIKPRMIYGWELNLISKGQDND